MPAAALTAASKPQGRRMMGKGAASSTASFLPLLFLMTVAEVANDPQNVGESPKR